MLTTEKRAEYFPNVPTLAESGMPEFELTSSLGAVVRSGSPKDAINHLSTELVRAMQLPEVKDTLIKAGIYPAPSGPEEFDAIMRADVLKIQKIVREAKLKLDS